MIIHCLVYPKVDYQVALALHNVVAAKQLEELTAAAVPADAVFYESFLCYIVSYSSQQIVHEY